MDWVQTGEVTKIFVKVTPYAKLNKIDGLITMENQERLIIRVQAPPDKGKANKAVCALLAKTLGVPKSTLKILTGEKSQIKTVAIDYPLNETDLTALLAS